MTVLGVIGDSLAEAFFMFWDTLWALVLGFALSGAVQAFVSRRQMRRVLGDHGPAALGRASLLGAASSSCSYAASALAKSLFARGADFTASIVFMVASTNLVVELGLVLWLLVGWQFTLAEYVGGAIMIVLLGLVLPRMVPARVADAARERLNHGDNADSGADPDASGTLGVRLRDRGRWADAASYTISDLTMLRKELLAGFVVAGFLAMAVPTAFWQSLFLTGHGFWSSLENAVLGPLLALISFVCSVGNVPLAAALWHGGISFGGVIAFVFADLITIPLLLIYRKFYGTRVTLRLLATFWLVMSVGGLAVEYLFDALGLLPGSRPTVVAAEHFSWNYTTFLDIAALLLFALVYWAHRNRERLGGGIGYATDPVCGMQVETTSAPASLSHHGSAVYFCSDRCRDRFEADPGKYAAADAGREPPQDGSVTDPVCGMHVDPERAGASETYAGRTYHFCGPGCRDVFAADPLAHLGRARDPLCGMDVDVAGPGATAEHDGRRYVFCCSRCRDAFEQDPESVLQSGTRR
ncbi:MAG: permease [Marmoricola sp.]